MKKFLLAAAAVLLTVSFCFAGEKEEVMKVIDGLYNHARDLNGSALLAQVTDDYTEINEDGEKIDHEEFKKITADLTRMKEIIAKGSAPRATLADIAMAIAALDDSEADAEMLALAKEVGNTPEGKKLADTMRKTLAEMLKIYTDTIDQVSNSLKIVSITVNGDKACAVYRITRDNKLLQIQLDLVKVNGKWLAEKSSAVKVE